MAWLDVAACAEQDPSYADPGHLPIVGCAMLQSKQGPPMPSPRQFTLKRYRPIICKDSIRKIESLPDRNPAIS
jgi:hypothetical protein